jgi:hypothetical protein
VEIAHQSAGTASKDWPGLAKGREHLGEDFIGSDQLASGKRAADEESGVMSLIPAVRDRYPVKRVGKYPPHAVGRLGVP